MNIPGAQHHRHGHHGGHHGGSEVGAAIAGGLIVLGLGAVIAGASQATPYCDRVRCTTLPPITRRDQPIRSVRGTPLSSETNPLRVSTGKS